MPLIEVDVRRLSELKSVAANTKTSVDNIRSQFYSIGNALDWDVKICSDINSTINQINRELNSEISSLKKMESFFDMAITKYREADNYTARKESFVRTEVYKKFKIVLPVVNKLLIKLIGLKKFSVSSAVSIKNLSDKIPKDLKSIALKSAEKIGLAGKGYSIVSDTYSFLENMKKGELAEAFKAYTNVGKTTYDTVSMIEKAAANGATSLTFKEIVTGDISALKEVNHTNQILTVAESPVRNQILTTAESATKISQNTNYIQNALGKITKVDVVISALVRTAFNISENKKTNMGTGRMIAEIAGETLVDLGTKVLVGAAVAAVGFTGISAAVVTVAAVVGLNALASRITNGEKDFTEWVSDSVLDNIENRIEASLIGRTVQKVQSGEGVVSAIKNSYTDKINDMKANVSSYFGNARTFLSKTLISVV